MGRAKGSTRGTTMVEVLVAFAVLVLLMAMFSQAMGLAGRMMNQSIGTMEGYHDLAGRYYLDELSADSEDVTLSFYRVDKDGNRIGEGPDGFHLEVKVVTHSGTDGTGKDLTLYEITDATSAAPTGD